VSPDEAFKAMMDGNDRFLAGQLRSFDEDLKILKDKTSEKQEPFAADCSASVHRERRNFRLPHPVKETKC
jgi:carbonic anhydrase